MATKDEILGTNPQGGNAPDPIVKKEDRISAIPAPSTPEVKQEVKTEEPPQSLSYVDMLNKISPYTPPTEEELEKERKKEKREKTFSALGDGISALSNLYFTTQGAPNMHSGKSLSAAATARWDKLKSDRKENSLAYYSNLVRAQQADQSKDSSDRAWRRQLERDELSDQRYTDEQDYKRERDSASDAKYSAEREYAQGRDKVSDERWQTQLDENKRQFNQQQAAAKSKVASDADIKREQIAATRASGVRGKQLGFADGSGKQVSIYENVWRGSMQQVYDAMLTDMAPTDQKELGRWKREMSKLDTPTKKEDYVKQNWHKSPSASSIMMTLSNIDPATMTSTVDENESEGLGWGARTENETETDW